jgi:hypothetical protein
MKTLTMTVTFTFEADDDKAANEDIAECVMNGFIAMRDNSWVVAHTENYETGEISEIRINDFTIAE